MEGIKVHISHLHEGDNIYEFLFCFIAQRIPSTEGSTLNENYFRKDAAGGQVSKVFLAAQILFFFFFFFFALQKVLTVFTLSCRTPQLLTILVLKFEEVQFVCLC